MKKPLFFSHSIFMIFVSSLVGILEYILLISREANFKLWSYGMSVRSFISWTVFVTLYVNGRGVYEVSFFAIILASLYPGAFSQFMIGLMVVSSLCNFTRPLKVGAVGFKFTYFHFSLLFITLWHSFCCTPYFPLYMFCDVSVRSCEVIVGNKVFYFFVVFVLVQYHYRISFVCFGDEGFVFLQLSFYLLKNFVFFFCFYIIVCADVLLDISGPTDSAQTVSNKNIYYMNPM